MTSILTREQAELRSFIIGFLSDPAHDNQSANSMTSKVFRIALAAIDSEPVVFTDERNLHHIAMGRETSLIWGKQNSETGDIPLYRHAQPALVVPEGYVLAPKKPTVDMICAVRDYVAPLAGLDAFEAAYMAMLQAVDTSRNPASEGLKG